MREPEDKFAEGFALFCVIIIIALKLIGAIHISWFWLTSIIWLPFLLGIAFAIIVVFIAIVNNFIDNIKEKRNERN